MHSIAMLGDRAVRFHAAGIVRELSWVSGATALVAHVSAHLVDALERCLAQPVKRFSPSLATDAQSLSMMLRHGDVLRTEGNTRMTAPVRGIARSFWTHAREPISSFAVGIKTKEYRP